MMRYLMRLNVEKGTARKADIPGYYIGGKTGTADKVINGHYSKSSVLTDFMAVIPADQPRYLLLIMLDDPKALPETSGFEPPAGTRFRSGALWSHGSPRFSVLNRVSICPTPIT